MAFLYGWSGHIGPDPLFESTSYLAVRRMRNRRLYLRGLLGGQCNPDGPLSDPCVHLTKWNAKPTESIEGVTARGQVECGFSWGAKRLNSARRWAPVPYRQGHLRFYSRLGGRSSDGHAP